MPNGSRTGWSHFEEAAGRGRGVILMTPHLGNWEFGGPLLIERGVRLHVVTLPEPGRLTKEREDNRRRWGIETLVIGEDPFNFLQIIQRLEAGATVALLIDRPWGGTARVEMFSRSFEASLAPAELARATGAALVPVYLPRTSRGYSAHVLPEIAYARPELRSMEGKRELTQKIIRAFEGPIRQHPTQWYRFVPVWPATARPSR